MCTLSLKHCLLVYCCPTRGVWYKALKRSAGIFAWNTYFSSVRPLYLRCGFGDLPAFMVIARCQGWGLFLKLLTLLCRFYFSTMRHRWCWAHFALCTWKSRDLACCSLISSAKKFRTVEDGRTTTAIVDRILWFAVKKNSNVAENGEEDEERRDYRTSRDVGKRRKWCVHRKEELVITSERSVSIMAGNGLNSETPDVRIKSGWLF